MATTARLLDHVTLAEGDRIQAAETDDEAWMDFPSLVVIARP